MKQVVTPWKKKKENNKKAVLKLEIDYELVTLFDAIKAKDSEAIRKTKGKLEQLRKDMMNLEV
ncbi:hypothetical protein [Sutcliffiella deserti]|uniref:hypothetical protein n=1 Tax=Sutcliffiella deserti TaxID=2875501 RepID=UPI001CBC82C9|nr:hypothetical protein [Sutcliffiella deserti]